MTNAYIVAAKRTPIGKFGGALKDQSPVALGAHVMDAVMQAANAPKDALDLYIMGNVLRAGHGQLLPRQAAVAAGIPESIDGYAIDMVCSSAMMAVVNAATLIRAGDADLVLAGGMESMSQAGFFLSHRARWGYKYLAGRPEEVKDVLEYDGLRDPFEQTSMGAETERLTADYSITRDALDEVAYQSHRRAAEATANGTFANTIAPVTVKTRRGEIEVSVDEGIRADTSLESLGKLRSAFASDGVLTAGNASQLSDGAAALLIASEAAVKKYDLTPLARVAGSGIAAVPSWRFVEAPVPAVKKMLTRHNLKVNDIDYWENNEAFATNSVLFHTELGVDPNRLNIYGGGISLGHPIGASGTRIIVTLLNALQQNSGRYGIASLCHGTGGGTAVLLERV